MTKGRMTRRSLLSGAWLRPQPPGPGAWIASPAGEAGAEPPAGRAGIGAVRLDRTRCLAFCAACVERCPVPGALVAGPDGPRLDPDACDGCGRCIDLCPSPGRPLSRA